MLQRFSCAGDMDYLKALAKAMVECPPRWNFSNWNYLTAMKCSPEETYATHDYGVELRRRAWAIVAAAQYLRDTTDVSHERVKARADDRGAPAQSSALPSNRTSLFEHGSSEKSGLMPKQQPQTKQITDRKEVQHGEQKEGKDQQLVGVYGEGTKGAAGEAGGDRAGGEVAGTVTIAATSAAAAAAPRKKWR